MTKAVIISLINAYAQLFDVEPKVALAVARKESNFEISATGAVGEVGIFQIRPEFVPMFSEKQLREPHTNIMVGMKMLKDAKDNCVHQRNLDWLVCYNYGAENAKNVKHPSLFPYVVQVKQIIKKIEVESCNKEM